MPRPSHVEYRLRLGRFNCGVELADVFAGALGVFHRQGALLLQYDVIPARCLQVLVCLAFVQVHPERGPAAADEFAFQLALAASVDELGEEAGQIVAGGEAVANEEDAGTIGHGPSVYLG